MNNRSNLKKVLSSFLAISAVCGGEFACNSTYAISRDTVENIKKVGKVVGIPLATFLFGGAVGFGAFKISDSISKKKSEMKNEEKQYKNESVSTEKMDDRVLVDFDTQVEASAVKFEDIKLELDELCHLPEIYKKFCLVKDKGGSIVEGMAAVLNANPNTDTNTQSCNECEKKINECEKKINECKKNLAGKLGVENYSEDDLKRIYDAFADVVGFAQKTLDLLSVIQASRADIERVLSIDEPCTKDEFTGILNDLTNSKKGADYLEYLTNTMQLTPNAEASFDDEGLLALGLNYAARKLFGSNSVSVTRVNFAGPETIAETIFNENYENNDLIYGRMSAAKRKFIIGAVKYSHDQIIKGAPVATAQ